MHDIDPKETQEWLEALENVIEQDGKDRAAFLLQEIANQKAIPSLSLTTPYINTIDKADEPAYPGDLAMEERITAIHRWNAVVMVLRATKFASELGGHLSSYASAAVLYEVGFNHFFKANTDAQNGDLLFVQGHSSPGIYARAFLEGQLSEKHVSHFRQEISGHGLSSYPHPWLMPDFWQFPTVSMGLGPLQAIYQARFLKYLHHRGLADTTGRKVWAFIGDGEMDEPESVSALSMAARENLDNLIFVVNCNLQRLDGPVRGNAKIIQELESIFHGARWNVLKVVWNSAWDALLEKDTSGALKQRMMEVVDGEYQNFAAQDVSYFREHFFGKNDALKSIIETVSDDELKQCQRGGHDFLKVYAAYHAAVNHKDQPTVILAKTVKGYGLGSKAGESRNVAHNQKKMSLEALKEFRDRWEIPVKDNDLENLPFYHPGKKSKEVEYLLSQRKTLGGKSVGRREQSSISLTPPSLDEFQPLLESTQDREISTTMAFVRILNIVLKDKNIGKHIVPIIPDESRTFGMEGLFRQCGIYSPVGQLYTPVDRDQVMYYREAKDGQVFEEGLNEAGAYAAWMSAASSYSVNNLPMIPFYIYYSMFGFQRVGDLAWASGDARCRGFLIGGTSGRTTLAGEGLQHQDGHQLIYASTIPNCIAYDPTYAYEMAVIIQEGLRRMLTNNEDVFYYITAMNENYAHPEMPKDVEAGILKGMYLLRKSTLKTAKTAVQLLGSGTILREVIAAAEMLEKEHQVKADVWSVTSFTELRREAMAVERDNLLHPEQKVKTNYVAMQLDREKTPVIAATDYMRAYADQIRGYFHNPYVVLGTDGYGRSDTRKALRDFFEVDRRYIVIAALKALVDQKQFDPKQLSKIIKAYRIDPEKPQPVTV